MGNLLIKSKAYDAVVIALAAIGSVPIADWAPGGKLHDVLRGALRLPDELAPTRVVISEGATDRIFKTDPAAFKASYQALIQSLRAESPKAPLYVSFETGYCSRTDDNVWIQAIRSASLWTSWSIPPHKSSLERTWTPW